MAIRGVSGAKPLVPPSPPAPSVYASLVYFAKDGDVGQGFKILAPTIQSMVMFDNTDELRILGYFGDFAGSVTVGGVEAAVTLWDPYEIRCMLPATGDGTAGDVVVDVRGHKSNVHQLSEWRGIVTFTHTGPGGLTRTLDFDLHFRADLSNWRALPDTNPLIEGPFGDGQVTVFGANDSVAAVTSVGTYTDSSECHNVD
jgi:hypothetical protein